MEIMSATVTQQIINNGPRNLVLKYTIAGTSGDVTAKKLVDASAIDSTIGNKGLKLVRAQWALSGFSCNLLWGGGPDVDLLEATVGDGEIDLNDVGGVTNNAVQQSADVLFTTNGYTASGEGGHIILHFKKRNPLEDLTDASPILGAMNLVGAAPTATVA
jgi:hypothetical protein